MTVYVPKYCAIAQYSDYAIHSCYLKIVDPTQRNIIGMRYWMGGVPQPIFQTNSETAIEYPAGQNPEKIFFSGLSAVKEEQDNWLKVTFYFTLVSNPGSPYADSAGNWKAADENICFSYASDYKKQISGSWQYTDPVFTEDESCISYLNGTALDTDAGRSIYVWDQLVPIVNPQSNPAYNGYREKFFSFLCAPHGNMENAIDTIFLCGETAGIDLLDFYPALRLFIADAHSRKLKIYYLAGDASWSYTANLPVAKSYVDKVMLYNKSVNLNEQFDGIQFDIEPYLLSGWQSIWGQFISNIDAVSQYVKEKNNELEKKVEFGVAIPRWYDTDYDPSDTYSGSGYEQIINLVDYVVVMNYTVHRAVAANDVLSEIEYASSLDPVRKVYVAFETLNLGTGDVHTSFWNYGNKKLNIAVNAIERYFGNKLADTDSDPSTINHPSFAGVTIHYYESPSQQAYRNLKQSFFYPDASKSHAPVCTVITPNSGETLSGKDAQIEFEVYDNDSSNISVKIFIYHGEFDSQTYPCWEGNVVINPETFTYSGLVSIDTTTYADASDYKIRIVVEETGSGQNPPLKSFDESNGFLTIYNTAPNNSYAQRRALYDNNPMPYIAIDVTPCDSVTSYTVTENIPEGAYPEDVYPETEWDQDSRTLVWGPFNDNEPRQLKYALRCPDGTYNLTGVSVFDGAQTDISGIQSVTAVTNKLNIDIENNNSSRATVRIQPQAVGPVELFFIYAVFPSDEIVPENISSGGEWNGSYIMWSLADPAEEISFDVKGDAGTYVLQFLASIIYAFWEDYYPQSDQLDYSLAIAVTGETTGRKIIKNNTPFPEIELNIVSALDTKCYAVEEIIPAGIEPVSIESGGVWDIKNRKIKWGPFFDNIERELNYTLSGFDGSYTICGVLSRDGVSLPITGDSEIVISGTPVPQASRSVINSTLLNPQVALTVVPGIGTKCYAIEEIIPAGIAPVSIESGGVWDIKNRKIKWGPFFDNIERELNYTLSGFDGSYTICGVLSRDGVSSPITGDSEIVISGAPMPQISRSVINSISANPEIVIDFGSVSAMSSCIITETIPEGITPGQINFDGIWDPQTRRIIWGPFINSTARQFRYQITGEPGKYILSGYCTIDEILIPITGAGSVFITPEKATYYVSPDGSDTNTGCASDPWQTIQFGINHIPGSCTLIIKSGFYSEPNGLIISNADNPNICGSSTAPTKIIAEESVKIDIPSHINRVLSIIGCAENKIEYISVEGFDFLGTNTQTGIYMQYSHNCVIKNNILKKFNSAITALNCSDCVFECNECSYFKTAGIELDHSTENSLTGNVCSRGRGDAITEDNPTCGIKVVEESNSNIIGNNVCSNNESRGMGYWTRWCGVGIYIKNSHNNILKNNLLSNSKGIRENYQGLYMYSWETAGIFTAGNINGLEIYGNILKNNGLYLETTNKNIIAGIYNNVFDDCAITLRLIPQKSWKFYQQVTPSESENIIFKNNVVINSRSSYSRFSSGATRTDIDYFWGIWQESDPISISAFKINIGGSAVPFAYFTAKNVRFSNNIIYSVINRATPLMVFDNDSIDGQNIDYNFISSNLSYLSNLYGEGSNNIRLESPSFKSITLKNFQLLPDSPCISTGENGVTMGLYDGLHNWTDSDGDGMPDWWETQYLTDCLNDDSLTDTDNDGLTNYHEFYLRLNPAMKDTDSDGLGDGYEIANNLDPLLKDTDGDGMPDGWELKYGLNPRANDADLDKDSDGLNNFLEYYYQTYPDNPDSDSDGLTDKEENDLGTDPKLTDTDNDGSSDKEEIDSGNDPLDSRSNIQNSPRLSLIFTAKGIKTMLDYMGYPKRYIYIKENFLFLPDSRFAPWEPVKVLNAVASDEDTGADTIAGIEYSMDNTNWVPVEFSAGSASAGFSIGIVQDLLFDGLHTLRIRCRDNAGFVSKITEYKFDCFKDSDLDGLRDSIEETIGTDTDCEDSDCDGLIDGWEVFHQTNPLLNDAESDPDNDGLANIVEYQAKSNPRKTDTDNDGFDDYQELNVYNTSPLHKYITVSWPIDLSDHGMFYRRNISNGESSLYYSWWQDETGIKVHCVNHLLEKQNETIIPLDPSIYSYPASACTNNGFAFLSEKMENERKFIKGYILNNSGSLINSFELEIDPLEWFISSNGYEYLITYKDNTGTVYGQRVSSDGNLIDEFSQIAASDVLNISYKEWDDGQVRQYITKKGYNNFNIWSLAYGNGNNSLFVRQEIFENYCGNGTTGISFSKDGDILHQFDMFPLITYGGMYSIASNGEDFFVAQESAGGTDCAFIDNDGILCYFEMKPSIWIYSIARFGLDYTVLSYDGNQQCARLFLHPQGDTDNDGLINRDEVTRFTDPVNPDTDNDGYTDGEEIANSTDPLVPNPRREYCFSVHSPVELHIFDSNGNHTGPAGTAGEIESNIRGSRYIVTGEIKECYVPAKGIYQVCIIGTGTGNFDFFAREYEGDNLINEQYCLNVPVTVNLSFAGTIKNPAEPLELFMDSNGDGIYEKTIPSVSSIKLSSNGSFFTNDSALHILKLSVSKDNLSESIYGHILLSSMKDTQNYDIASSVFTRLTPCGDNEFIVEGECSVNNQPGYTFSAKVNDSTDQVKKNFKGTFSINVRGPENFSIFVSNGNLVQPKGKTDKLLAMKVIVK